MASNAFLQVASDPSMLLRIQKLKALAPLKALEL
jgi:hypothetical protein